MTRINYLASAQLIQDDYSQNTTHSNHNQTTDLSTREPITDDYEPARFDGFEIAGVHFTIFKIDGPIIKAGNGRDMLNFTLDDLITAAATIDNKQ